MNGGLPSVSGFSSASTAYGVSSHTPPISGTDNMMGMASHQSDPLLHGRAQLTWRTKACANLVPETSSAPGHLWSRVCHLCLQSLPGEEAQRGSCCWSTRVLVWGFTPRGVGLGGAQGFWHYLLEVLWLR